MACFYSVKRMVMVFFSVLTIVSQCFLFGGYWTIVASQEQFERAVTLINNCEEMSILLRPGVYSLKASIKSKAPLIVKGRKATITTVDEDYVYQPFEAIGETSTHYIHRIKGPLPLFSLFCFSDGRHLPVSESTIDSVGVNYVEGRIEAPNIYDTGTLLKIPIPSNLIHLKNKRFSQTYGYLDSGWGVVEFQLNNSDESFFYCKSLNRCASKNYMMDKESYGRRVRFVLFNAEVKDRSIFYDNESLYIPKEIGTVYIIRNNTEGHPLPSITIDSDIKIDGIRFEGISSFIVNSKEKGICEINSCVFLNTIGNSLRVNKENGKNAKRVLINKCSFDNCSLRTGNIVFLESTLYGPPCIEMRNCIITRYPNNNVMYKNTYGAVKLNGDVAFYNNIVYNTCRDHINCGAGYIEVKGNILYNTDSFNRSINRNLSSDWGIIYCDHQFAEETNALNNTKHRIILERNLLYGAYAYGGDARGIFIDDGRGDVVCKDNIILNTQLFSIDSRNTLHAGASVRNRYEGNVVSSYYRLAGGKALNGDNVPVISGNVLFETGPNVISNVKVEEADVMQPFHYEGICDKNRVKVTRMVYRVLRECPAWRDVKGFIGRY